MKSTPKSEATRAQILDSAIGLFRRKGFEQTTMRDIAAEAGVATGAAYYYFDSKNAIVLAFYDQARKEMEPLLEEVLAERKDLKQRIQGILEVKLKYFEPNRRLLGALTGVADPQHPLSPFGEQTREIREADIRFFDRALEGSRVRVPDDLQPHLPFILWMYQMGLILFWIHDGSHEQERTHALLLRTLDITVRLIKLAGFPLMRPVRKVVVDLMGMVRQ